MTFCSGYSDVTARAVNYQAFRLMHYITLFTTVSAAVTGGAQVLCP